MTIMPPATIRILIKSRFIHTALFGMKVTRVVRFFAGLWIYVDSAKLFAALPTPTPAATGTNYKTATASL